MFEKNAEEIMRQNGCRTHSGNFIQADKVCELIQKGAEFGYNQANEWHYVKDGLPKKHGWYWVQYNNGTPDCLIVTKNLRFLDHRSSDVTDCIYAWKEIILPELKENE